MMSGCHDEALKRGDVGRHATCNMRQTVECHCVAYGANAALALRRLLDIGLKRGNVGRDATCNIKHDVWLS